MKKFKFVLLTLFTVLTISCSSSDDDDNGSASDATYIKFKVNGTQLNMIEPSTITSMTASISSSVTQGGDVRSMILTMPVSPSLGTHDLTSSFDLAAYGASYSNGSETIDANSGTITITSIGAEYMQGTFSFSEVSDGVTYNVTEGSFRAFKPEAN